MQDELLTELSEKELAPPEYYPIQYAIMWIAFGNKPINLDYAKIIYEKPPSYIAGQKLVNAEKKLLTYLRSGKISAKSVGYEQDKNSEYKRTEEYYVLERETWKGSFNWDSQVLFYCNSNNEYYEYTDIILNTKELIQCDPIDNKNATEKSGKKQSQKIKDISTKERNALYKIIIGMAIKGYGYDPRGKKSTVPKEIESDLAFLDINLTAETIREYLKKAYGEFPVNPNKP